MNETAKDVFNSGRRDKLEIMASIVALTREPMYIWEISRKGNFSHQQLKQYLNFMIEKDLIEKHKQTITPKKTTHTCKATQKGHELLKIYCDSLRLIYGEDYLTKVNNNLVLTCLQYCKQPNKTNP